MFIYDLKLTKGDTFDGVTFTVTDSDTGAAIDLTDYSARMEIRSGSKTGTVAATFTTDSGLTIADAEGGQISIDPFSVTYDAGYYQYDIQFTDGDGDVYTWIGGQVRVVQDVTQPAT